MHGNALMPKSLRKAVRGFYNSHFHSAYFCLQKELKGMETVLDLGCGRDSPIKYCQLGYKVGVDLFGPYLREGGRNRYHDQYIKADIRKIRFKPGSFDAAIALDVLEHIRKPEGYELMRDMEKWAVSKVIIQVPNGYIFQEAYDNNPLQSHQSAWYAVDFERLGYEIRGVRGLKQLRGHVASPVIKPLALGKVISCLSQEVFYHFPSYAFQLFCVKEL